MCDEELSSITIFYFKNNNLELRYCLLVKTSVTVIFLILISLDFVKQVSNKHNHFVSGRILYHSFFMKLRLSPALLLAR